MAFKFMRFGIEKEGGIISSLLIIFFSFTINLQCEENKLIVKTDTANVYLAPDLNSRVIETLKKGTIISRYFLGDTKMNWYYVSLFSEERKANISGFIHKEHIEIHIESRKYDEAKNKGQNEIEVQSDKFPLKMLVKVEKASIRIRPNSDSSVILQVELGELLHSTKRINDWYRVYFKSDKNKNILMGYIHQSSVNQVLERGEKASPGRTQIIEERPGIANEADFQKVPQPKIIKKRNFHIKIGAYYFSPSGKSIKSVYGGGFALRSEMAIKLWKNFGIWIGGSFFSKDGYLTFTKEVTKLTILPIGGGVKYWKSFGAINLYVGMGLNYYQFKETNPIGDVSNGGLGYIGMIGGSAKIIGGLLFEIFSNYSYCNMIPADFEINVGGIETGIGLAFEF
ncbi:hypothetical protein ACFLT2_13240 [Acidobacteriota bacterium]